MSHTRTGHTPDAWRDDGPQSAQALFKPYSAIHAANVGQMSPVLTAGAVFTADRLGRGRKAYSIHPENRIAPPPRPICGVIMRNLGEPCARRPGHAVGKGGAHRTAESMNLERLNRSAPQREWRNEHGGGVIE